MSVVMNLQEAAQATSATLIGAEDGAAVAFRGVSTDSRKIEAGQLFIALRGENFDGHEFLATASAAGAGTSGEVSVRLRAMGSLSAADPARGGA